MKKYFFRLLIPALFMGGLVAPTFSASPAVEPQRSRPDQVERWFAPSNCDCPAYSFTANNTRARDRAKADCEAAVRTSGKCSGGCSEKTGRVAPMCP